ncbi:hypothetical protein [Pedobacter sp. MC2016-24]|nr:hypothetical protein [Pedobacter sp. MC2016-24]MBE9599948.1 hypothetical protein [Pedobacter sp. MC2016-24]
MKNQKSKLPAQKTQTLYRFKKSFVKRGADTDTSTVTTTILTSTHIF